MPSKLSIGSLYAGVGGICMGFEQAGFKLSWANELDKRACQTYRNNFKHTLYEEDIMRLDATQVQKVDILTAGFPCQPFSVAGYRKGFDDKRGNHFFRILEFVELIKPEVIFLENVKNLRGHDQGRTYEMIEKCIREMGYSFDAQVLNTKDYGNVPHNRERIFMVCFKNDSKGKNARAGKFLFPKPEKLNRTISDLISKKVVDEKFYYRSDRYMYEDLKREMTNPNTVYQWRRKYVRENKSNVCPTLTANMGTGGHNVPLVLTKKGIRKLTPEECFEFQGFPMQSYKLPSDVAMSHLYKQAGNSVSVPVIYAIAKQIKKALKA